MLKTCPNCHGTGILINDCPYCRSTDDFYFTQLRPGNCKACEGDGYLEECCQTCKGSGQIESKGILIKARI